MAERLFVLIWNTIGICVIIGIGVFVKEWISHGASWDGVYRAHVKHLHNAEIELNYKINR